MEMEMIIMEIVKITAMTILGSHCCLGRSGKLRKFLEKNRENFEKIINDKTAEILVIDHSDENSHELIETIVKDIMLLTAQQLSDTKCCTRSKEKVKDYFEKRKSKFEHIVKDHSNIIRHSSSSLEKQNIKDFAKKF